MQKIAKIRTSQFHIYLSLKPELTLFLGIIVSNATKWLLGKSNMVFSDNGSTIEAQNSFCALPAFWGPPTFWGPPAVPIVLFILFSQYYVKIKQIALVKW